MHAKPHCANLQFYNDNNVTLLHFINIGRHL